jgi:putative PIN family toxin of toxin-antitoxin system
MVVVVDTNVLVGACMDVGASARVIELCIHRQLTAAVGSALIAEYEDVLSRTALFEACRLDADERSELLDIFMANAKWVKTYFTCRPNFQDKADNHVIELAVASSASRIVTWNTRDFASAELRFPLLRLANPGQLLQELQERKP